jgi:ribosomal protein S18 acetylase RimI-like enzyme
MASFRPATIADLEDLLALQQQYYAEEGYLFAEPSARAAWNELLNERSLGRVWVAVEGATIVAYVVVTFGFSLEYRGRDAVLDELFVIPAFRRRGLGREALQVLEAGCRASGVQALHLVVDRTNEAAIELYRGQGFVAHDRQLMTKRFNPKPDHRVGEA